MSVVVITPPDLIVTAEEAIAARVFSEDDDPAYIEMLLYAAQMQIDGPKGWLGRSIGYQVLEYRADEFCRRIILPCPPVFNVLSVGYLDSAGALVELAASDYRVYGSEGNYIEAGYGFTWPVPLGESDAVRVQYEAGYVDEDHPELQLIKHAIMLMAKEVKEEGSIDQGGTGEIRSETVEGVSRIDYQVASVSSSASASMRSVAEKLLSGFWTPFV